MHWRWRGRRCGSRACPARLDGPERELRLLVDHSEDLVAERTRAINRLRWHLHELDPGWDPRPRSLSRRKHLDATAARLAGMEGMAARIAADLTARITVLTTDINALEKEITARVRQLATSLLAMAGTAELTAAKTIAESAGVGRFRSKDAYARHNGTAPLPAWSANPARHRLSRTGNRQLNCAIHRIAVTQKRCHLPAQAYLKNRIAAGDTPAEALRALKRRISDAVYRNLKADTESNTASPPGQAA